MLLIKKKSSIDGVGIFAQEMIKSGEVFYLVPTDLVSKTPKSKFARIGGGYVDDSQVLNFVNHSCDSNTKLDISGDKPQLVALREIDSGEEVTCDYNRTEVNGVKVKCNCGSKTCRGYFLREE